MPSSSSLAEEINRPLEQDPEPYDVRHEFPSAINLKQKMDKYFQSQPPLRDTSNFGRGRSLNELKSREFNLLDQQRELIEYQHTTMKAFAHNLELPKREVLYFDGSPENYPRFIKNVEINIERKVLDNYSRLSF